ncbi:hypothetical protein P4B35_10580 [Pontiellaceae bacterium B12227]|nr:hypothetical protein [Pontiellaceae bacterium B12227]
MSVNTYLTNLSSKCILLNMERTRIDRSLSILKTRLRRYFGADIKEQLVFGSYSRRTILPRKFDKKSDVDYMVVFKEKDVTPQTFLDRLRRFAMDNYSRSQIKQSNPTIVLSLNHIHFELVPAIPHWWDGYRIPAKVSDYQDWLSTDPSDFKKTLIKRNEADGRRLKPLIRLMKCWNAHQGYPFESYALEQMVVEHDYTFWPLRTKILKNYFYQFVLDGLTLERGSAQWKKDVVEQTRDVVREAKRLEKDKNWPIRARNEIRNLFPKQT